MAAIIKLRVVDLYRGDRVSNFRKAADFGIWGIIHKATTGATGKDGKYSDRRSAALDRLVGIAELPEGHGPEGQASHTGILPIQVRMAPVFRAIVKRNTLFHVRACDGWVAEAEGSDCQRLMGLDELGSILGRLTLPEEPLGQLL